MSNKCLGQRIKELREQSHLSQSQVAAYLNIDQSYLSKIESSERMITVDHMERLAELYGCTFEELNSFETEVEQLKISFRAKEITIEDMNIISEINHIAANSKYMAKLLGGEKQ